MKTFLLFLLLLLAGGTAVYVYQGDMLPIQQIQIDGELQHADMDAIQHAMLPYIHNGLLRVNIGELQQALMSVPWIAQARVSRIWPDTLHIWLAEPQAVAVWANSGIVDREGHVYYLPRDMPLPDLPVFEGLEGQVPLMLTQYMHMQPLLAPLNLMIARVILTPRFAWEIELDNGMVLRLGQQQVLERLQRFINVYPQWPLQQKEEVEYVDLRYPNGLALKMREGS